MVCRLERARPWGLPLLQVANQSVMPFPVIIEAGNWLRDPDRVTVSHGNYRGGRANTVLRGPTAVCAWRHTLAYYRHKATLEIG